MFTWLSPICCLLPLPVQCRQLPTRRTHGGPCTKQPLEAASCSTYSLLRTLVHLLSILLLPSSFSLYHYLPVTWCTAQSKPLPALTRLTGGVPFEDLYIYIFEYIFISQHDCRFSSWSYITSNACKDSIGGHISTTVCDIVWFTRLLRSRPTLMLNPLWRRNSSKSRSQHQLPN